MSFLLLYITIIINKSGYTYHWLDIVYFHLTVRTSIGVVIFHTLPAHDHMPAIEEDEVSDITITNNAHLILRQVLGL